MEIKEELINEVKEELKAKSEKIFLKVKIKDF